MPPWESAQKRRKKEIMSDRLLDKVVLITGAARGQGAAEARLFAENGARLVISDVQEDALGELGDELRGKGHEVAECVLDVASPAAWSTAVQRAETQYGRLDVLVNNAGILTMAGVEDTDLDTWDRIVAVNQTGTWLGMKAAVPALRRAQHFAWIPVYHRVFDEVGNFLRPQRSGEGL
ncbi:SDR family NAD(P)-dependent oxidoreductase [Saccharopolyspora rhizosphaerae]|uniref:SDR family NAD(P)-dependent oxidoreductase n=1 Tax=Saccharopolyspora rhizosphaerae TaxID=2492662 RepID=A0A3R8QSK4_9PSEU|nr:SDR family NAD(P)-dependent oxidoreductase [Saccharopolyspora rhizosphaerae]RRO18617.1 SDR family NAD(P)-dependent oxidoreductase [Saccharopolyspora rhizosphaerae]